MDYSQAAAIVSRNYVYERIVNSTLSTLSEPAVKQMLSNYLRWNPAVKAKVEQGTLTLPELLGILNTLDPDTRARVDQWVREKTNKGIADMIVDAQNFEAKLPEGAEAVRIMVLHNIKAIC